MADGDIVSNIRAQAGERMGEEALRAAVVKAKLEAPSQIAVQDHRLMISFDEREMVLQARNGVTWPIGTMEDCICEMLEQQGIMLASDQTDVSRSWSLSPEGHQIADSLDEEFEEIRIRSEPDYFAVLS